MKATVLNVDDNAAGRYARSRFLARAGFRVTEASSGGEAIRLARECKPDIILLDVNLPDIDGLQVCQVIKADQDVSVSRTPVIFLTASRLADVDVVSGLDAGADNYLTEPVEPSVLVATVRALLRAKEAEEELVRMNEQLRRFAFIVSHELQEPLRMVKSYTQLLAHRYKGNLDKEADDFINYTVDGVTRMQSFIRDMLAYSQAAEGGLETKPMPAQDALDEALKELEAVIGESGADISVEELPTVMADCSRISQVFRNLIGNAIKYAGSEAPRIHISAKEDGGDWVFSVKDNGIGIEEKYAEQVFGLFKRLHGRERAGSGVGLAICREIVEHHGGRIWVESSLNAGSTFRFTLPKAGVDRTAAAG